MFSLAANTIHAAEKTADYPAIDTDRGDYTYFNSNYPVIAGKYYYNTSVYEKSSDNSVNFGRTDYKNPERDDGITIEKNDGSKDVYIDVDLKKSSLYKSTKEYKYFVISADIKVPRPGAEVYLFRIRDNALYKQEGYKSDRNLLWIAADGSLNTANGVKTENFAQEHTEKTASVKIYIELETNTADIYIDGKAIAEKAAFYHKIKSINKIRLSLNSGTGSFYIKNWDITGLEKPYSGGSDTKSSVFYDDSEAENYLANKVVFHYYGKKLMKNGVKYNLASNPVWENNILYVGLDDFNKAFDTHITYNTLPQLDNGTVQNGDTVLVPAAELAEKDAGKYSFTDNDGAVYISDSSIGMEQSEPVYKREYSSSPITELTSAEMLNDYVLYSRPKAEAVKAAFNQSETAHPRLFANKAELDKLIENAGENPRLVRILNTSLNMAENVLKTEPSGYEFEDSYRMITHATEFQNNMLTLGFAYRVTGESKYAERAWEELNLITDFPDLNTPHVIDTGTFLTGLGIAYDWFYDAFSEDKLKRISDTAINLGIKPLNSAYYGRLQGCAAGSNDKSTQISGIFPKWTSNYNAIANSGVLIASLAMAEVNPDLCFDSIEKSVRSLEYAMKGFNPGGGWIEGADYCALTLSHLNRATEALKGIFGTDYGLTSSPGFDKTAEFIISLQSGNTVNNFHDSCSANSGILYLTWLGIMFDDDAAINVRNSQIDSLSYSTSPMEVIAMGKNIYSADTSKKPDNMIVTKGTESFSVRNTYNADNAAYLSAHGGAVSAYHSHNDASTFVMSMLGEQWAVDLGKESYNSGVSDRLIYRKRTEGHNTVTINNDENYNQLPGSFAPLTAYASNDSEAYAVYDMSDLYRDADTVQRGFFADRHFTEFTVRDEIALNKQSEVYWFMHTRADNIKIDGNIVTLTQNGKSIKMNFLCSAENYEIIEMNAVPLESSYPSDGTNPYENQNPNEGARKIAVRISGSGSINLTVKFSENGDAPKNIPISEWNVCEEEKCDTLVSDNFADTGNIYKTGSTKLSLKSGLFGRSSTDKSLLISGKGTAGMTVNSEKQAKDTETSKLSFYYAFDKAFTPVRLDAAIRTANETQQFSDFVKISAKELNIAGNQYKNPVYHTENKWYHFELLLDKNGFKAYIDNMPIFDGECDADYRPITELVFNMPDGGNLYTDDFKLESYINGALAEVITETGMHCGNDEIEKYAQASLIRLDTDISCGDFMKTASFDAASGMVLRDKNGAEALSDAALLGKYADITLIDGTHRYLSIMPLDKKLLYSRTDMVDLSKVWHKNGGWSSMGRSLLTAGNGVGGRLDSDESIVMQGPFKKASDSDTYGHDYLDFSIMSENSVASYTQPAFCPIVLNGSVFISGGAMFECDIKINSSNRYITLFRTENGKVCCGMNSAFKWDCPSDEWVDFSVSLYPGKQYADITVNGNTARTVYTNPTEKLDFMNIIRFGARSYDLNESGYIALDDIFVYSGKNSDAVRNIEVVQNGRAVKGYYSDGNITIRANTDDTAVMYAAVYKDKLPVSVKCGTYMDGVLQCAVDDFELADTEIKIMIWDNKMKPLAECGRFMYKASE